MSRPLRALVIPSDKISEERLREIWREGDPPPAAPRLTNRKVEANLPLDDLESKALQFPSWKPMAVGPNARRESS